MRILIGLAWLFISIAFGWSSPTNAESAEVKELRVKAALVFQFTKFIEWPAFTGDFTINVIDDEPLANVLRTAVSSRKILGRSVKINSTTYAGSIINFGQIVIFPKKESPLLGPAINKFKDKACLTVSHGSAIKALGSDINFVLIEGKMRFELNPKAMIKKNLKVDPKLIDLGLPAEDVQ